jgi:hypothetical protein
MKRMKKTDVPQQIQLTAAEAEALKARIAAKELSADDIELMIGLISFSFWLQQQLAFAKLTIDKLKSFFGFTTEKKTLQKLKAQK